MVDIIPAIIAESFEDLTDKMVQVKGLAPVVQIDVCDGRFVPSKCWPYIGDDENDFERIMTEDEGFPFWEILDFEADLMISKPEDSAENWIHAGAKRIILHIESSDGMLDFVKKLRATYGYPDTAAVSIEIGIGINIATDNTVLDPFLSDGPDGRPLADFVQCMGIDRIGYQHQEFDEAVLDKIHHLKTKYPELIISVDGGVNFDNAHDLVEAGASRLISGSTLYESDDMKGAIEEMKNS